ncbi:unnamed protein product [Linum tenue]|uniref:Pre-mRNA-processing factor 19 n=1 Tax=Linum tenue TaxID=586396 RepID=A0AAV0MZA9_9ROSI|nr:unnamed protein product [Linum tenue]
MSSSSPSSPTSTGNADSEQAYGDTKKLLELAVRILRSDPEVERHCNMYLFKLLETFLNTSLAQLAFDEECYKLKHDLDMAKLNSLKNLLGVTFDYSSSNFEQTFKNLKVKYCYTRLFPLKESENFDVKATSSSASNNVTRSSASKKKTSAASSATSKETVLKAGRLFRAMLATKRNPKGEFNWRAIEKQHTQFIVDARLPENLKYPPHKLRGTWANYASRGGAGRVPPSLKHEYIELMQGKSGSAFASRRKKLALRRSSSEPAPFISAKGDATCTLASFEDLGRYYQLATHAVHKGRVRSIDIEYSKDIIATGGDDCTAVLFDYSSRKVRSTLTGHSKKVTTVKFAVDGEVFLTGSADKTIRVWERTEDESYVYRHTFKNHMDEVRAITVNAEYFVSASLDATWWLYDLYGDDSGPKVNTTGRDGSWIGAGYTAAAFHPEGTVLGLGTCGGIVKIWDVRKQDPVAELGGHVEAVTAMSFSETHAFLATAAEDGVKLWDCRTWEQLCIPDFIDADTPASSVTFGHSCPYLGVATSSGIRVSNPTEDWNCIKTRTVLSDTGRVSCVGFGQYAKYLAVGSMDGELLLFEEARPECLETTGVRG